MGQLLEPPADDESAYRYFPDSSYYNGRIRYAWPNPAYPRILSAHAESGLILVEVNYWIEDNLSETVFTDFVDLGYRVVRKNADPWDRYSRSWNVPNMWRRFHFRKEESALAFKLKFGEFISEITEKSPKDNFDYTDYERM